MHQEGRYALCQVEKVVLFFLAKQVELASRLLKARREITDCKTGVGFGATAKEMEEEWVSDSPISRYGDSPARSLRFVYLSMGGEIVRLMRFLQLNGKASRTMPPANGKYGTVWRAFWTYYSTMLLPPLLPFRSVRWVNR